jgi:hypothetical protein
VKQQYWEQTSSGGKGAETSASGISKKTKVCKVLKIPKVTLKDLRGVLANYLISIKRLWQTDSSTISRMIFPAVR